MRANLVLTFLASTLAASCIPSRDNSSDPAIRPRPVIAVFVGGADTGGQGGRHAEWTLDGSGSSDPNGVVEEWEWSMSATTAVPTAEEGWVPIGTGVTLDSQDGAGPFALALRAVTDFSSPDGIAGAGIAERWIRLIVEDDAGVRSEAMRSVSVVNRAPVVTLGGNRRVTVGGRWWEAADDAARAPEREIVLEAAVSDPDGDDPLLFTAANPATWTVSGALARELDNDGNGSIDVGIEDNGRRLRFSASTLPSSSRIGISVSDVVSGPTVIGGTATDGIAVDVRSNAWVFDASNGALTRLDGSFSTEIGFAGAGMRLLGADSDRILSIESGTNVMRVVDAGLVKRAESPLGTGNADFMVGASDGRGGWWVQDGLSSPGRLWRFDDQLALVDGPVTNLDGGAADDLSGGLVPAMVRAAGGSSDVWLVGGPSSAPGSRILRVSTALTIVASAAVPSGSYSLAPDADGGVWATGGQRLRHATAAGVLAADVALPAPCAGNAVPRLARDPVSGVLWVSVAGAGVVPSALCSFDVDVAGTPVLRRSRLLAAPPGSLLADDADGSVLLQYGSPSAMTRFTADLASSDNVTAFPGMATRGVLALPGGAVVLSLAPNGGSGGPPRLQLLERAEVPVPLVVPTGVDPLSTNAAMAIDPDTGSVWLWRSDCGCLERYGADGDLAEVVEVPGSQGGDGALAIAPASGTLHLAWAVPGGNTGRALSMTLAGVPGGVRVLLERPGLALQTAHDLAVSSDGTTLCVAGAPTGADPLRGPGTRLTAGAPPQIALTNTSGAPSFFPYEVAAAISPAGACTFSADTTETFGLLATVNTQGTISTRPGRGLKLRSLAVLPWDGVVRPIAFNPLASDFFEDWLPLVDANGLVSFNPTPAQLLESGTFIRQANDLTAEPLYRHLFVGFGDQSVMSSSPGRVVRLAPDPEMPGRFSEVGRTEGFGTPVLW